MYNKKTINKSTYLECHIIWLRNLDNGERKQRETAIFGQWCYKTMLQIIWRNRFTNEEVLQKIGERNEQCMKKHTTQKYKANSHEIQIKMVLEEMVERNMSRERPHLQYIQQIIHDVNCKAMLTWRGRQRIEPTVGFQTSLWIDNLRRERRIINQFCGCNFMNTHFNWIWEFACTVPRIQCV